MNSDRWTFVPIERNEHGFPFRRQEPVLDGLQAIVLSVGIGLCCGCGIVLGLRWLWGLLP